MIIDDEDKLRDRITTINDGKLDKVYNQTVKKVTEDYQALHFNTAISQLMVFVNDCYKADSLPLEYVEGFVKLLAPLVPHLAEELWTKLGHVGSIAYAKWPEYDESLTVEQNCTYAVSFNGKTRFTLDLPKAMPKEEVEATVRANAQTAKYVAGGNILKMIVVPGKIVNVVVK